MNGLLKVLGEILPFAVVLLIFFLLRRNRFNGRVWPSGESSLQGQSIPSYVSVQARPVLTKGEAVFHEVLNCAVGGRYIIFAQVPLAVLVNVQARHYWGRRAFWNRIDRRRVDFVLVDPTTLRVKIVIELDDRSHQLEHRIARDELVAEVLKAAGLKLVRVRAQMAYDPTTLRAILGLVKPDERAKC